MAERKHVDWESVERDYSAGLLSLREIAAKYGTKESTIRSRAEVNEWSRDLAVKIARKSRRYFAQRGFVAALRAAKRIFQKKKSLKPMLKPLLA